MRMISQQEIDIYCRFNTAAPTEAADRQNCSKKKKAAQFTARSL